MSEISHALTVLVLVLVLILVLDSHVEAAEIFPYLVHKVPNAVSQYLSYVPRYVAT